MAIGKEEKNLVIGLGFLIIAYFGIIKPVTDKLGLTKSDTDKAEAELKAIANSVNGWDPNYYKTLRNISILLPTDASATVLANQIYKAWGIINDNEQAIYAVFRQIRSQAHLSFLCEKYNKLYKQDLLTRLKTPWHYAADGLDEIEFLEVAKIVAKLPNYIKA